ncbi:MAG: cytidylate kinase family protein [Candidatus Micrarchaeia archaeon]|jgi:cytidylate kinase
MPVICISGLTGSGKNAAGEALAKLLNLRVVSPSFKIDAKERGISLMDMQALAGKDKKIDLDFDNRVMAEALKGGCVVTTWLGPWMVKHADLRVLVHADEKTRAERVAKRDSMPVGAALAHIRKRDADNRERYMRYYNIDIADTSIFDLKVDSGKYLPEKIAAMIAKELKKKARK